MKQKDLIRSLEYRLVSKSIKVDQTLVDQFHQPTRHQKAFQLQISRIEKYEKNFRKFLTSEKKRIKSSKINK